MKIFVLDCSVTMSWCFTDESADQSKLLLLKLMQTPAIVPQIWSLEVSNVLIAAERRNRITTQDVEQFISIISKLPIEIDLGLSNIINLEIIRLARKHKLSAYDAAYLELALRFKAPLATFDKELARAAQLENIKLLNDF